MSLSPRKHSSLLLACIAAIAGACDSLGPVDIQGRVVGQDLQPEPGLPVLVNGMVQAVTDLDGRFSLTTRRPYDLAVVDSASRTVTVFTRLTRSDPTLQLQTRGPFPLDPVSIGGKLSGGAGYPQPVSHRSLVAYSGTNGVTGLSSGPRNAASSGDYSLGVLLQHGKASLGSLDAFQLDTGGIGPGNSGPKAYVAYGRGPVSIAAGQTSFTGDVALHAVTTDSIRGTVSAPSAYQIFTKDLKVLFGGQLVAPPSMTLWTDSSTSSAFTMRIPGSIDRSLLLTVTALKSGDERVSYSRPVAPNAFAPISITLPAPVAPIAPLDRQTIPSTTSFTWSGPGNCIYFWTMEDYYDVTTGTPGPGWLVTVVTTASMARIPDLVLPAPLFQPPIEYYWFVTALGPFATIDDATGPNGFMLVGESFRAVSRPVEIVIGSQ